MAVWRDKHRKKENQSTGETGATDESSDGG
jgi:hypothetical protein